MRKGYDIIAWCYDLLACLVFGKAIKKAQAEMLGFIPEYSRLLIAGGGTGWILEEITGRHSSGLMITFVDASKKMIERAQSRNTGSNTITYINNRIEDLKPGDESYDVLITGFFFDNFTQAKCQTIFEQLHNSLAREGVWLFTDFIINDKSKFWQKLLLRVMYSFFKVVCSIEAARLPDINNYFISHGYKTVTEKKYFHNFIISSVLTKSKQGFTAGRL